MSQEGVGFFKEPPDIAEQLVARGYGVRKFWGQTVFFISKDKYRALGADTLLKKIIEIFGDEVTNRHFAESAFEYESSYELELPSVLHPEELEHDDKKFEKLIEILETQLQQSKP